MISLDSIERIIKDFQNDQERLSRDLFNNLDEQKDTLKQLTAINNVIKYTVDYRNKYVAEKEAPMKPVKLEKLEKVKKEKPVKEYGIKTLLN